MKNKYDDLVNKFVDNALSKSEINEVEHLVNNDKNFNLNLTTHKYVHESLHDIPQQSAPQNIAENIMKQIIGKLSDRYNKNYFFRVIVFAFISILITFLFMLFFYGSNLQVFQESTNITGYLKTYTKPVLSYGQKIITSDIFKTVSGLLSFVILLGFYFTFNSYKELKNRLKQF
jgi:ATP-dependent Zn protease